MAKTAEFGGLWMDCGDASESTKYGYRISFNMLGYSNDTLLPQDVDLVQGTNHS